MQLLVFCLGLRYATWILSFGHMTKNFGFKVEMHDLGFLGFGVYILVSNLRLRCVTWNFGV